MSITKVTIAGFRGFAEPGELRVAVPTGKPGSGLTVLVGPNGGGKSTIVESLRVLGHPAAQSFTESRRNKRAGDRVSLRIELSTGEVYELRTVKAGGSETEWDPGQPQGVPQIFVLPSRRHFSPFFGKGSTERLQYTRQGSLPNERGAAINEFSSRLFRVSKNREPFDTVLRRIMSPVPEWTIDQTDQGNYYIKIDAGGQHHTSDGAGEGIVSLFFIIDALYDSKPGETIVIDEPELSLHPLYQERLVLLLAEYASDRQIIYATHSPYFVDFDAVQNGAQVVRVQNRNGSCRIHHLSAETGGALAAFARIRTTHTFSDWTLGRRFSSRTELSS